jgi:hypothetical protein
VDKDLICKELALEMLMGADYSFWQSNIILGHALTTSKTTTTGEQLYYNRLYIESRCK